VLYLMLLCLSVPTKLMLVEAWLIAEALPVTLKLYHASRYSDILILLTPSSGCGGGGSCGALAGLDIGVTVKSGTENAGGARPLAQGVCVCQRLHRRPHRIQICLPRML